MKNSFKIYLANIRGMCAGVERAIKVVNLTLDKYKDRDVYVLHEVVHNTHVVKELEKKGAHFVESLDDVPENSVLIFSAHGVGIQTYEKAKDKGLYVIDATCPLVKRVHFKVNKASKENKKAIVIGHDGHQEVKGTVGQYDGPLENVRVILTKEDVDNLDFKDEDLVFATQTTLSIDETSITVKALKEKYPSIEGPLKDDTCYATQHRQNAIKELAKISDVVIVAGSKNSSNSNRLREVAENEGALAYLVDDYKDIDKSWFYNVESVGISAGASVPEYIVEDIIKYLLTLTDTEVIPVGDKPIDRTFPLPDL